MNPEIFVPFVFFGFLAAVILVPTMLRERTKRSAHDLVSQALARGQNLNPELVQQLTQNMLDEGNRARKSLGNAVVLLSLAAAFVGLGFVFGFQDEDHRGILVPAVILGAVGMAYGLLAIIDYASRKRAT